MARGIKTGGRKKGTPNKTTTEVKAALIEAFDELGGVDALAKWGAENPTEFYKLWVKILPTQSSDSDESDNQPITRIEVVTVGQNATDQRD